jgi:hypothetical protein
MSTSPDHLLTSLGVLTAFSISKRISNEEVSKLSRKIKRTYKDVSPDKFQQLLSDALIEATKKYIVSDPPPGLIFQKGDLKKEEQDKFYMELSVISQALASKFVEQKLSKHQVCYIINSLVNILGVTEDDFEDFHEKFQKYKDGEDFEE